MTALGPEHAAAGQPAHDRVTHREWVNPHARQAELIRIKAGEALSIQGALKVSVYEKNGEHRASLDGAASHVLLLRQPPRKKADADYAERREMPLDDAVPA